MVSVESWSLRHYEDLPNKVRAYYDFPAPISTLNPVSGDGVRDYRTYSCVGMDCTNCLSPTDMSFYTQGTWDALNLIRAQYCPTKVRANCTMGWEIIGTHPNTLYMHTAQFRFGIIPK